MYHAGDPFVGALFGRASGKGRPRSRAQGRGRGTGSPWSPVRYDGRSAAVPATRPIRLLRGRESRLGHGRTAGPAGRSRAARTDPAPSPTGCGRRDHRRGGDLHRDVARTAAGDADRHPGRGPRARRRRTSASASAPSTSAAAPRSCGAAGSVVDLHRRHPRPRPAHAAGHDARTGCCSFRHRTSSGSSPGY